MQVAVIGSGYVGLVAAACLAEIGHEVMCIDNDAAKIAALQQGQTVIHEDFLPVLLERHRGRSLHFTTSLTEGIRDSTVIFIAVGTPASETGDADVSLIESVCQDIAQQIHDFRLVVVKSTVPAGTNRWMRRVLQRNGVRSQHFETASNPEFLREGTAVTDFLYPDRIVLGCDLRRGAELLQELYRPLLDGSYAARENAIPAPDDARIPARAVSCSSASAELIKQASNAFLAMKISFINAVANVCEGNRADIEEVVEGIGSDQRIGNRFLKPGIGYGGSCFPKDLLAFRAAARDSGYEFRLLDEVIHINEHQRRAFVRKVRRALWTLKGKRLGVLGLAFKGGTDDVRESPAIAVIHALLEEGAEIISYDPAATAKARENFAPCSNIRFVDNPYDAANGADALLVLTDWEEFASLDLSRLRDELKHPIVIDGRNFYSRKQMLQAGFSYYSMGRPELAPELIPKIRRAIPRADAA
ncbi:MAG: UDP-glucose/GDP-mannose dehydrogenase family protein [Candidatus Korobacteraceae bacterium]